MTATARHHAPPPPPSPHLSHQQVLPRQQQQQHHHHHRPTSPPYHHPHHHQIINATHCTQLVQPEDYADPTFFSGDSTPVFLIHDGGGTSYSYHCLGRLYRFVYAISNPYFHSGGSFPGGIPEMARTYVRWIRDTVRSPSFPRKRNSQDRVNVVIGGWSLGGLLSLEVARLLMHEEEDDDDGDDGLIHVSGLVLVDSVCPQHLLRGTSDRDRTQTTWAFLGEPKNRNDLLARRCMTEARSMISQWSLPAWSGPRPPAVLIKARDAVPTVTKSSSSSSNQSPRKDASSPSEEDETESPQKIHTIDVTRQDRVLGWGDYEADMFVRVIETGGHHFNLFKEEHIGSTTMALRKAFATLDD